MRRLMDRVRAVLALLGPLGAGSHALLLRLVGRFGWKAVVVGAAVVVYATVRYRTWIAWMLLAWCAAAWMHAPSDEDAGETHEEAEEEPTVAPVDPFPNMIWDLIGDAPGVHVKSIVAWLHETGLDPRCTATDVTAGLDRRGIPVRASVRGPDGRVNKGVHRDDLEAWMQERSPAASVPLSKTHSSPVATAVTSGVAGPATGVATPPTPAE